MKIKKRNSGKCFVALLAMLVPTMSYGAYSFKTDRIGGFEFSAYYDSSVSSYGYTSAYDFAREGWNDISSNVYVGKTTSTSSKPDKYYVGVSQGDVVGRVELYLVKDGWWFIDEKVEGVEPSEDWTYANVSLYDNVIQQNGYSAGEIRFSALHEVGHTLALVDTYMHDDTVMNNVVRSVSSVTAEDEDRIIEKHGR